MNVIVKTTQECNLDCTYCFDREKRTSGTLPIDAIRELCKKDTNNDIHGWIWFGGEPLMTSIEYYKEAYNIIKEAKGGKEPKFQFQTNGTLLNDEWIKFAKETGSTFGLSFDGLANEKNRGVPKEKMEKILDKLHSNSFQPGLIMVVNEETEGSLLDNYLYFKSLGVHSIAFNKVFTSHRSDGLTEEFNMKYMESFKELFEYWANDENPINVRQLDRFIEAIVAGTERLSCTRTGMCEKSLIGLNHDGRLTPCDRWFPEEYMLPKSIYEYDSLETMFKTQEYRLLAEKRTERLEGYCADCIIKDYCKGGCPANAVFYKEGLEQNENVCKIDIMEWAVVFNYIKNKLPVDVKNPKLQRYLTYNRTINMIDEVVSESGGKNE